MSNNKRPVLEEVDDDDIDNMDMILLNLIQVDYTNSTKRPEPTVVRSQDSEPSLFPNIPLNQVQPPPKQASSRNGIMDPNSFTEEEKKQFDQFQIIYPCYFDINRSHKQGRRVVLIGQWRSISNNHFRCLQETWLVF